MGLFSRFSCTTRGMGATFKSYSRRQLLGIAEPDLISLYRPKPRNLVLPLEKALVCTVGDVFAFGTAGGNHRTDLSKSDGPEAVEVWR